MLGFLFVDEDVVHPRPGRRREAARRRRPRRRPGARTTRSRRSHPWSTAAIQEALQADAGRRARAQAAQRVRAGAGGGHRPPGLAAAVRVDGAARPRPQPGAAPERAAVTAGRAGRAALPPDPPRAGRPGPRGGRSSASSTLAFGVVVLAPFVVLAGRSRSASPSTGADVEASLDRLIDFDDPTPAGPGLPQPRPRQRDPGRLADQPGAARPAGRAGWPRSRRGSAGAGSLACLGLAVVALVATLVVSALLPDAGAAPR